MSNSKGVRFSGTDDEWNEYVSIIKKEGRSIDAVITQLVNTKLMENKEEKETNTKTTSRHQDILIERILQQDLSRVLVNGYYHVSLNQPEHLDFIQTARHELGNRVIGAVYSAVYEYWLHKWAVSRVNNYSDNTIKERLDMIASGAEVSRETIIKQEISKMRMNGEKYNRFYESVKKIKVTFSCDIIPKLTLCDLTESSLGNVIQFDCVIIGPSPKKLETESGRYIQKVLIQEPEDQARENNPVVMKSVFHAEDTMNVASGQTKRVIGVYTTQTPANGEKVQAEKTLIIDVINTRNLEEKEEVTLTTHQIQVAREACHSNEEEYLNNIIASFCPKIFGRKLEKKALILSLLGGTDNPLSQEYRRESHLMLISEADSGKSELLKFTNNVAHKCSIVDGSSSTGVGLLFALDEYDGIKILRSGAMILNNGGNLIVDEYDKMKPEEQRKLNRAMEQQTAEYNKGGHVGRAQTKTGVIVACNPKNERWVTGEIIDNIPTAKSGVTRFDNIIRVVKETHENELRAKMNHIMQGKRGVLPQHFDISYLKGLFNHQRRQSPLFSPEAEELLINKFIEFTMIEQQDGAIPIQTRQMEGIQRLCEAYAKLTFRKEVTCEVVDIIILFYQECLATLGMNVEKGIQQMDLRGHSINKDAYFEEIFRELSKDGNVFIHELAEELQKNTKMFNTDDSITRYVEGRKSKGWLYEPKVGILRRQ